MPRPDLISQEYITPVSVTNFRLFGGIPSNGSARSDLVYCDLRPKPLSSRRKRFIVTNVGFFVLHLCAMLTLVLYMTIQQPLSRSAGSQGCELCDLWCASNCSQLTRDGDLSRTQRVINVNETQSGRDKSLCCVKRRDTLSTNYEEYLQKQKSLSGGSDSATEKIFDGIRLKDDWIPDIFWPAKDCNNSFMRFHKKDRLFTVTSDVTLSVHSRIDFTCTNKSITIQKLETQISNPKFYSVFVDERAQLGQSRSTRNGSVIYTSTINAVVKLQRGNTLKFSTNPSNCALPRTLVVYQTRDADL